MKPFTRTIASDVICEQVQQVSGNIIDNTAAKLVYGINPIPEMCQVYDPCEHCNNPQRCENPADCNCTMNPAGKHAMYAWLSKSRVEKAKLLKHWGFKAEDLKDKDLRRMLHY